MFATFRRFWVAINSQTALYLVCDDLSVDFGQGRQHLRMAGPGDSFEAVEGPPEAADMLYDLLRNVGRVEPGELSGGQDLQIGAGVAGQHCIPVRSAPLSPLTLGQLHRDRAGLEGDGPASPLGGAPVDELPDGGAQVGVGEAAPSCGNLAELIAIRMLYPDQTEGGQQGCRLEQQIAFLGPAPEDEGVDEVVVRGMGNGTGIGPRLCDEDGDLRKALGEALQPPPILGRQARQDMVDDGLGD